MDTTLWKRSRRRIRQSIDPRRKQRLKRTELHLLYEDPGLLLKELELVERQHSVQRPPAAARLHLHLQQPLPHHILLVERITME